MASPTGDITAGNAATTVFITVREEHANPATHMVYLNGVEVTSNPVGHTLGLGTKLKGSTLVIHSTVTRPHASPTDEAEVVTALQKAARSKQFVRRERFKGAETVQLTTTIDLI